MDKTKPDDALVGSPWAHREPAVRLVVVVAFVAGHRDGAAGFGNGATGVLKLNGGVEDMEALG